MLLSRLLAKRRPAAYQTFVSRHPHLKIIPVSCLAHIRRAFFEVRDDHPRITAWILHQIGRIYRIEATLREQRAGPLEPQQLDILAKSTGLIRRRSKHFSAAAFLLSLLKTTVGGAPQLRCIASRIGNLLNRSLSKQALGQRFSECSSAFLLGIISRLIITGKQAPAEKLLSRFSRVIVEDSSQFAFHKSMSGEFPGHGNQLGDTAGCKIDFAFDLVHHSAVSSSLWPSTTQD